MGSGPGEGGSRIFPDRYYPLLGLMPVSLATMFGENKTNRQLAASPTLCRCSPVEFHAPPHIRGSQTR
jgi:hypothetical protein